MDLRIRWLPPLDKLFGPVSEIPLKKPTPVADVLSQLTEQEPEFAPYARFKSNDRQPHGLLVWRGGKVLTLGDDLHAGDEIEMIMMVAGG
jgi:sulfur carrier protein ThiS